MTAFKYVAEGNDTVSFEKLKDCLLDQDFNEFTSDLILKQMGDWENDGQFDYKAFAAYEQ